MAIYTDTTTSITSGLRKEQREQLVKDGWCIVEEQQIGSREVVLRALRSVNLWCADVQMPARSAGVTCLSLRDFVLTSFCAEIRATPAFLDIVERTGLRHIIDELIGSTEDIHPQIALRFPDPDSSGDKPVPHVDGFGRGNIIDCFNLLAGVYLCNVRADDVGNFVVWPGSHRALATFFSKATTQRLISNRQFSAVEAMIAELPCEKPVQLHANIGDVVLCHYLLRHGPAVNRGHEIRYMVFMRFRSSRQDRGETRHLGDLWRYWNRSALSRE